MPDADANRQELTRLVRSALAHLYDYAYLQNHPLATMLDSGRDLDQVTRAQKVRRVLLDCLEQLRPQGQSNVPSEATRAYAILTYRYVDGLSTQEIASKLALSRRQFYREHEKGMEATASLLADRLHSEGHATNRLVGPGPEEDRLKVAQVEVERLRQNARPERLALDEVLQNVVALLAPRIDQTGGQIKVFSTDPWPTVVADRVMLRQALLNLLSYALDSISEGDLALTIARRPGQALIEVVWDSSGAARCQPPDSAPAEETSVRLAVAQTLIEAQGGRLEIDAAGGRWQGQISLPVSGRQTVLVIDDNQELVSLLQRYLGGHEISVVGVTEGERAVHLATDLQPQLITLDLMMPNQDGWETLQKLKTSPATRDIPVVICSVLHEPQLAWAMGANDYVTKPVRQDDLLVVLRRWLGPLVAAG